MKNFAINTAAVGALTTAALQLVGTAAAAPSGPRALIYGETRETPRLVEVAKGQPTATRNSRLPLTVVHSWPSIGADADDVNPSGQARRVCASGRWHWNDAADGRVRLLFSRRLSSCR